MWQERQAGLLREEIEAVIASLDNATNFYRLVKEQIEKTGRFLSVSAGNGRLWPLLPLEICEAISGRYEHAIPAAASIQLLKTAAEVFDDIEDADSPDSLAAKCGNAIATNVGTTLVILAEVALTRLLGKGVEPFIIIRVIDAVNSFHVNACAGQHLDLSLTSEATISEDVYLRVTGIKAASTVECACHIGALLGNAPEELVALSTTLGHNLGMAAQIANDIQGIIQETDIVRRKTTLPVIYGLAATDGETRKQILTAFGKRSASLSNPAQTKDLLFRTGAIHYATVKMESYKQQALSTLSEIEEAGINVSRLKSFLE